MKWWWLVVLGAGCSKPAAPGALTDFQPAIGQSTFTACTEANDGKRFALTGFFRLGEVTDVSDGKLTLWLHERLDKSGGGAGARTALQLEEPKHVVFEVSDLKAVRAGYRQERSTGRIQRVTLKTSAGARTLDDEVVATVELTAQHLFNQKGLFGCSLDLVGLRPAR